MAKEIVEGVHQIGGQGPQIFAFLLEHQGLTLVDAGMPNKAKPFLDAIAALGKTPADVKNILITHYHHDHIGSLAELAALTGATVYAPKEEADVIRGGKPVPKMTKRGLMGLVFSTLTDESPMTPAPVHEEVTGGDVLPDGIEVVATPGHTPGHVCYLVPDRGVMFIGDAAANLIGLSLVPVNEDFTAAEQSFVSLSRREFEVAAFCHGRPITAGAAQRFRAAARRYGG